MIMYQLKALKHYIYSGNKKLNGSYLVLFNVNDDEVIENALSLLLMHRLVLHQQQHY